MTTSSPLLLAAPDALAGQPVLLVGGSSGVGLASAALARALGAPVTLVGRDPDRLERARVGLDPAGGVAAVRVDATDPAALAAVLDDTAPRHVVLSTSGPFSAPLAELDVEAGLAYVRERLAPALTVATWAARHPGALASLTIVGGYVLRKPGAGLTTWAFIGPGLVGLIESLAVELAPTRVNEVAPGMIIDSPISARYFATDAERDRRRAEMEAALPARRAVTVDDVARQVLGFLTDPVITGNVRTVDAGGSLL